MRITNVDVVGYDDDDDYRHYIKQCLVVKLDVGR